MDNCRCCHYGEKLITFEPKSNILSLTLSDTGTKWNFSNKFLHLRMKTCPRCGTLYVKELFGDWQILPITLSQYEAANKKMHDLRLDQLRKRKEGLEKNEQNNKRLEELAQELNLNPAFREWLSLYTTPQQRYVIEHKDCPDCGGQNSVILAYGENWLEEACELCNYNTVSAG